MDIQPYKKDSWGYEYYLEDFLDGWNEAKEEYGKRQAGFTQEDQWVMGTFVDPDNEFELLETQIGEVTLTDEVMPIELEINGYTYKREDLI